MARDIQKIAKAARFAMENPAISQEIGMIEVLNALAQYRRQNKKMRAALDRIDAFLHGHADGTFEWYSVTLHRAVKRALKD